MKQKKPVVNKSLSKITNFPSVIHDQYVLTNTQLHQKKLTKGKAKSFYLQALPINFSLLNVKSDKSLTKNNTKNYSFLFRTHNNQIPSPITKNLIKKPIQSKYNQFTKEKKTKAKEIKQSLWYFSNTYNNHQLNNIKAKTISQLKIDTNAPNREIMNSNNTFINIKMKYIESYMGKETDKINTIAQNQFPRVNPHYHHKKMRSEALVLNKPIEMNHYFPKHPSKAKIAKEKKKEELKQNTKELSNNDMIILANNQIALTDVNDEKTYNDYRINMSNQTSYNNKNNTCPKTDDDVIIKNKEIVNNNKENNDYAFIKENKINDNNDSLTIINKKVVNEDKNPNINQVIETIANPNENCNNNKSMNQIDNNDNLPTINDNAQNNVNYKFNDMKIVHNEQNLEAKQSNEDNYLIIKEINKSLLPETFRQNQRKKTLALKKTPIAKEVYNKLEHLNLLNIESKASKNIHKEETEQNNNEHLSSKKIAFYDNNNAISGKENNLKVKNENHINNDKEINRDNDLSLKDNHELQVKEESNQEQDFQTEEEEEEENCFDGNLTEDYLSAKIENEQNGKIHNIYSQDNNRIFTFSSTELDKVLEKYDKYKEDDVISSIPCSESTKKMKKLKYLLQNNTIQNIKNNKSKSKGKQKVLSNLKGKKAFEEQILDKISSKSFLQAKDLHLNEESYSSSLSNSKTFKYKEENEFDLETLKSNKDKSENQDNISAELKTKEKDKSNFIQTLLKQASIKAQNENPANNNFSMNIIKQGFKYLFKSNNFFNQSNVYDLNNENTKRKPNKIAGYIQKMKFLTQFHHRERDIIKAQINSKNKILAEIALLLSCKYDFDKEPVINIQTDKHFNFQSLKYQYIKQIRSKDTKIMRQKIILSFYTDIMIITQSIWIANHLSKQYFDIYTTILNFGIYNSKNIPDIISHSTNCMKTKTLFTNFAQIHIQRRNERTKTINLKGNFMAKTTNKNRYYVHSFIAKEHKVNEKDYFKDINFFDRENEMLEIQKKGIKECSLEKIKQKNKRKGFIYGKNNECILKQIQNSKKLTKANIEKKILENNPLKNPNFFLSLKKNKEIEFLKINFQKNFMRKQKSYRMEAKIKRDYVAFQKAGFEGNIGLLSYYNANNLIETINNSKSEKDKIFEQVTGNYSTAYTVLRQAKRLTEYINAVDKNGNTLLMLSTKHSNHDIVKYLLTKECDVNIANNERNTALHFALGNKNFTVASLLIDKDANEYAVNNEGLTPWNCANNDYE